MARNFDEKQLLQIPEVIEEIKRHLWIESEKRGGDFGFEKAKQDWLDKYADGWVAYFRPDLKKVVVKAATAAAATSCNKPSECCASSKKEEKPEVAKKRSAKSYM